MSSIRKSRTGKWELSIRHKLLDRPLYFTYEADQEAAARAYGEQCDRWLAAGIVPAELQEQAKRPVASAALLGPVIRAWLNSGEPSQSDQDTLGPMFNGLAPLKLIDLNYLWAERWVRHMKLESNLSPGSIRKRVQAVARAIDWHLRKSPDAMVGNPLRLLPRGYSTYNAKDAREAEALGKSARIDIQRDRRLLPAKGSDLGEEALILNALDGQKRTDRERSLALKDGPAMRMLFQLILWSGLRLREAYTLTVDQVDMRSRVILVRSSKQWYGREKWRRVPIRPELLPALNNYIAGSVAAEAGALLFPFWNGTPENLAATSNRLSQRFRGLFAYAGCTGLTEHDLRHEATCRWFELRVPSGEWMFRAEEINAIMGWAPGSVMAARYASFRAEDLAARLYIAS